MMFENKEKNILLWLEKVLEERFGLKFHLTFAEDQNSFILSLKNSDKLIVFKDVILDFFEYGSKLDLPCSFVNLDGIYSAAGFEKKLPMPGKKELTRPLIYYKDNIAFIHYDIPGLIYWSLNRLEEVGHDDLDIHERFSAFSSHAYKYKYLDRPIVDEWLEVLSLVIKKLLPGIKLKENKFKIDLSHDVDCPSRYLFRNNLSFCKSIAGDVLRDKKLTSVFNALTTRTSSKSNIDSHDPYNTFNFIMSLSEKINCRSTFYFMGGRTDKSKDSNYDLDNILIQNLMKNIYSRGHKIGLHPSFNTFKNSKLLSAEVKVLKEVCLKNNIELNSLETRMHYLRWSSPETLIKLNSAGVLRDSTLGFADYAGFRCGTCFEYPGFDPLNYKELKIRIQPLIVMDCTIISAKYMGLGTGTKALERILDLKAKCKAVKGTFSLLWHNSELDSMEKKQIYQDVLI